MSSMVMCNFFVLFIFSNSVTKSLKKAKICPKKVRIRHFLPLVVRICYLEIKVIK